MTDLFCCYCVKIRIFILFSILYWMYQPTHVGLIPYLPASAFTSFYLPRRTVQQTVNNAAIINPYMSKLIYAILYESLLN